MEPTSSPTAEATDEETEGAALPSLELPDSAPELAALLPDEIGGTETLKLSMSGEELMAAGGEQGVEPEFQEFLDQVGGDPSSISVAFSFAMSADAAGVFAFRVEGADADALLSAFQAAQEAETGDVIDWQPAEVAGKSVLVAEDPETPGSQIYLYVAQDIIFVVTAADESLAEEILGGLP